MFGHLVISFHTAPLPKADESEKTQNLVPSVASAYRVRGQEAARVEPGSKSLKLERAAKAHAKLSGHVGRVHVGGED